MSDESKVTAYITTAIIGIVVFAFIVGQTAAIYWALQKVNLSGFVLLAILVIAAIITLTFLTVIISRFKEIAQEESDETRQY